MRPKHVHSNDAYAAAIEAGELNLTDGDPRFAGDWSYFGTEYRGLRFTRWETGETFYIPLPA